MASLFIKKGGPVRSIAPDTYEKVLAAAATALLAAVLVALIKGYPQWGAVPALVWVHLLTILVALVLTPYMLLRQRGTKVHRQLGKVWVAAMTLTAAISLFVKVINPGHFSLIHLLSIFVIVMAPRVWLTARAHNVVAHRMTVRGLVTGALIIAGYFTFGFDRMLGHWLFG
jgi:uncharacterized membrane protein